MTDITAQKELVQAHMGSLFDGVEMDNDGDLSIRYGSSRVFVRVHEFAEDSALAMVFSPLLSNVENTAELRDYVAFSGADYVFGSFLLIDRGEGKVDLLMKHNLLADHLVADELGFVVAGIASTCDELAAELAGRFGGEVFHPEAPEEAAQ
ncbi:hypothetical protein JOF28_000637 [Leucobacter exalbidus]|uniref:TY-Chap central domain-containing protein n=1 Tax=Leucobacter exalbidus TaxID=662960 RepID=A0A940PLN8_9MICO|nr:hypothetical protein [Leucobacter exalbidus]MBP1325405.1 hypothetical protein [Leucobacter exalbidus]